MYRLYIQHLPQHEDRQREREIRQPVLRLTHPVDKLRLNDNRWAISIFSVFSPNFYGASRSSLERRKSQDERAQA